MKNISSPILTCMDQKDNQHYLLLTTNTTLLRKKSIKRVSKLFTDTQSMNQIHIRVEMRVSDCSPFHILKKNKKTLVTFKPNRPQWIRFDCTVISGSTACMTAWLWASKRTCYGDGKNKSGDTPPHTPRQHHHPFDSREAGTVSRLSASPNPAICESSRHPACGRARPNTLIHASISCEIHASHTQSFLFSTLISATLSGNPTV